MIPHQSSFVDKDNTVYNFRLFSGQQNPNWDWGKPFDTSILDGYRQGVDMQI